MGEPDPTTAPPAAPAPDPPAAAAPEPPAASPEPAPNFKPPSAFRRIVGGCFWAGFLGGGVFLWLLGVSITLGDARLVTWMRGDAVMKPIVLLILCASIVAGLSLGWSTPIKSYPSLFGRLFGSLLAGSGLAFFAAYQVHEVVLRGHSSAERVEGMALAGALMVALAVARLRGRRIRDLVRYDVAARWRVGGVAAALVLVTAWPLSPSLRCRFGRGEGCRRAGDAAERSGDQKLAAELFEKGCDEDDPLACRYAAGQYQGTVASIARNLDHAEELLRDGCVLGDDFSCGRVHAILLEKRCDHYAASACRELAEAYAAGSYVDRNQPTSTRLFQKACLLGDEQACGRAR